MAALTKTTQTDLISNQHIAANSVVVGEAFDMSTKLGGLVFARFGRRVVTVATTAGVNIRIEASRATSGHNSWFPLAVFTSAIAATTSQATHGSDIAADTTTLTMTGTNVLIAGDVVYIQNNTTPALSEWARVRSPLVASASPILEDGVVSIIPASSVIFRSAEIYSPVSIPEGVMRIRAVADGAMFSMAFAVHVSLHTIDSII